MKNGNYPMKCVDTRIVPMSGEGIILYIRMEVTSGEYAGEMAEVGLFLPDFDDGYCRQMLHLVGLEYVSLAELERQVINLPGTRLLVSCYYSESRQRQENRIIRLLGYAPENAAQTKLG